MTHAESLIRRLCEERRADIKAAYDEAHAALSREVPFDQLPSAIRTAAKALYEARGKVKNLEKVLEQAGYVMESTTATVQLNYKTHQKRQREVGDQLDKRKAALKKLETAAIVDSLTLKDAALQKRLHTLQIELAKV